MESGSQETAHLPVRIIPWCTFCLTSSTYLYSSKYGDVFFLTLFFPTFSPLSFFSVCVSLSLFFQSFCTWYFLSTYQLISRVRGLMFVTNVCSLHDMLRCCLGNNKLCDCQNIDLLNTKYIYLIDILVYYIILSDFMI